ncbi:MAG TPA: metalloregulator ArsR/SmtB family transcription factor [Myxococcales bacterium]|nr:metalloregulator ArsR/SmtB family transcription factor [Myxococcales bacterium]
MTAAIKFYISTTIEVMNQQGRPDSKMIPRRPQSDSPRTGDGHPLVARQNYAPEQIRQAAANFRALSDPERLRLTAFLVSGEACVTDIAEAMGAGLSTVSQRLKVLRSEDVIVSRRAGKHIFYALADKHVTDLVRNALKHASEK